MSRPVEMLHWPEEPREWTFDPDRRYRTRKPTSKPDGLWLSPAEAKYGWDACVQANDMRGRLPLPSPARFSVETSRLLRLRSPADVPPAFRWSPSPAELSELENISPGEDWSRVSSGVMWDRIAREGFSGVFVTSWSGASLSRDPSWWYRWDCVSAVVWDLSAVRLL